MGERRPWQQIRYLDPDPEYLYFTSQVHYRQGYDIWARYGSCLQGGLIYARRGRSHKGWVIAPRFAVEEHNRVKGRNLKLIEILRVNLQGGSSRWYYITLLAKDEGENVSTYQALVTDNLRKKTMSLAYFGLAPYATSVPASDQNVTPLVASDSLATERVLPGDSQNAFVRAKQMLGAILIASDWFRDPCLTCKLDILLLVVAYHLKKQLSFVRL
ncbi:hypothetical protein RJ640_014762 [Escallonia rubra]|uniref:Cystatin domain-containing protein n=1 Tax=Escallonia rubra TaxID=112253 RepID=A0AA88SGX3_9ASTE|nr:hypothetical protein RJ640_014762 [Escallonia rubra]